MKPTPPVGKTVIINNPNFRPNTKTNMREVVFDMKMPNSTTAALGDMVCWMSAIKYVAEEYNYVAGHLIVPPWFVELAGQIMRPFEHWRVHPGLPDRLANGFPLKQPLMHPINATMMHLIDLGFIYFCGTNPPPEHANFYPVLDLDDVEMKKEIMALGSQYAVMTPGATAVTRAMPADVFNGICDHLIEKEITPVFLGVEAMDKGKRQVRINDRYDFSKGLNLIGQTTLLQAAKVMSGARMVIGIDNGLLHLAALTDATILYGYTMTGPTQRRVRRKEGHTIELYGDKEKLQCLFCQERVRFFFDHNFETCLYNEIVPTCLRHLNIESWRATIDQALGDANANGR